MTYEDLKKANEEIEITKLKNQKTGKEIGDYVEVNQRIKAFRMLYPEGCIETEMLSNENGVCVFKASVYARNSENYLNGKEYYLLGTGTAYEKEGSTFINKTSYIENCETSAVGRALAMLGIGIDKSIASAEEVENAVNNQEITEEDANNYIFTFGKYKDKSISEVYASDPKYLMWCLDKNDNEPLKQMIELITDLKRTPIPDSEEEQIQKLELMNELNQMIALTGFSLDRVKRSYDVKSTSEMSLEQLKDAIERLNKVGVENDN